MHHETTLITTIVVGLVLAFALGAVAHRLRISPIVGYLLAGVAVGPSTPGFVADQGLASQLAEIGVILLMFGVGLHFSLKDLLSVRAIAVPGAIVQIAFATALGVGLAWLLGWSLGAGLVFGLGLSVASTVVLLKALQERHLVESERGRIAVGWLIVEDLAMVLALVLLPALAGALGGNPGAAEGAAGAANVYVVLAITLGKVVAFVAVMVVLGRRIIPWVLHWVAHTGSRELFRLAVLAIALGVAYGAAVLFDVSFALGAFFAGMILSESKLSHEAATESLPLRDAFAVLFFVSVGMLFDPAILVSDLWPVLATLFIIMVGKSLAAFLIVLAFRHPMATALTVSASLAQIGEFSFILAGLGVALELLPARGQDLIVAGAILSILLNPLAFLVVDRLTARLARPAHAAGAGTAGGGDGWVTSTKSGHAVLVGHGRVGSVIAEALARQAIPVVVIEENDQVVARLKAAGVEVVGGPGAPGDALAAANVAAARFLMVAIPNGFEAGQYVRQGREANPGLRIVARAHSDVEVDHLNGHGADEVVLGERETALAMVERLASPGTAEPLGPAPVPAPA